MQSAHPTPDQLAQMTPDEQRALLAQLLRAKAERDRSFPMSAGQQGLWHAFRRDPNSTSFNVFLPTRVRAPLDLAALRQAIQLLADRHTSLRVTFSDAGGQLIQREAHKLDPEFTIHQQPAASEEQVRAAIARDVLQPFDLEQGPLLKVVVYQLAEDDWIVLALTHHIVVDFWSLVLILNELRSIYPSLVSGRQPALAPAQNNYAKFVEQQTRLIEGPAGKQQLDYWKSLVARTSGTVELPTDHIRPASFTGRAANQGLHFPDAVATQLNRKAAEFRSTPFAVVHSALQLLIARYTGQESFFIGSPFSCRSHREYEQTVGFFVNMLPLQADLENDPTFAELVTRTTHTLLGALEHEAYPIAEIVHGAEVPRDASRSPLFQVSCTFEKSHVKAEAGRAGTLFPDATQAYDFGGLRQEGFYVPHPTCHYDLEFIFELSATRLRGMVCYCRDLFDAQTIELMARNFEGLLQSALDTPHNAISKLPWTPTAHVVRQAIQPDREHSRDSHPAVPPLGGRATVHDLIEQAATQAADSPAMIIGGKQMTYSALLRYAQQLASQLAILGVGPGGVLPVCCRRGPQAFAAMLAAQLTGAAIVPIDADQPAIDCESVLRDLASTRILVSRGVTWGSPNAQRLCIEDLLAPQAQADSSTWQPPIVAPDELAYIVYTSGSTGKPKGVMIEHAAVSNTLHWRMRDVPLGPGDRVLMLLSHQFDAGLGIAWTTMTQGAALVFADEPTQPDPERLIDQVLRDKITVLPAVPSLQRMLVASPRFRDCTRLRYVWTGGESMPPELPQLIRDTTKATFWNFYGPTEAAIEATACKIEEHDSTRIVSIGKEIANTEVLILDQHRRPVPDTLPGEIAIGGAGLARGYLNQPELTATKFIVHPLDPEKRIYLTGDRGRRRADGNIEFLGRTDHQVKLRGYRIELGEIESVLESHPCVERAAIKLIDEGQPQATLIAFASLNSRAELLPPAARANPAAAIRRFLRDKLPPYKLPSALILLDEMPLTSSGKVDRRRLPERISAEHLEQQLLPPNTPLEQALASAWRDVLGAERVGVNQNFFDAGGSSLQAAMLTTQLSDELGVRVPTALVFDLADISQMALRLVQLHPESLAQRFGRDCVTAQLEAASLIGCHSPATLHSLIAPLKESGSRPPIFMVHPPGGIVVCYRELARHLDAEQPLYGIRSRGLHGDEALPESIDSMAEDYLTAMRSVQPSGPYCLGGWSLGGLVAYEMARQLLAAGEQVVRLILLDTTIPDGATELVPEVDRVNVGREYGIELTLDQLGDLAPEEQLPFLWEHAKKLGVLDDDSPAEVVAQALEDLQHLFHHHVELARRYRMQPLDVELLLFRPSEVPCELQVSHDRGWGCLSSRVQVHFVPGHHHSMVQPPHVQHLARQLQSVVG